jgi:DNA-binding HxlR family transcriptional regulator
VSGAAGPDGGPAGFRELDLTDRGRALIPALGQIAGWARPYLPEDGC